VVRLRSRRGATTPGTVRRYFWQSAPLVHPLAHRIDIDRRVLSRGPDRCSRPGRRTGEDVYVVRADGSRLVQVTADAVAEFDPSWSPDGRQIAYRHQPGDDDTTDIYVADVDGTDAHNVKPLQRLARVVSCARPLIPYLSRMTSKTEENRPESTRN
jgi:hypothetical protein